MELSSSAPPIVQLCKNFLTFCRHLRFSTVFKRTFHSFLSRARLIQFMPPIPNFAISTLISSSQRLLIFLVYILLLVFPPKSYIHSFPLHSCYIPSLILLDWIILSTWRRAQFMKLFIMQISVFFQSPITPSLSCEYDLLRTALSKSSSLFLL